MMRELFVDNFAGGGGASTGIEIAIGRSVDVAINHDPDAILMHKTNHPKTKHYCEDVWQVDPIEACGGNPVALAWFSPDCKHFSRAKGGKPVDKNIRGLAWVTLRWAAKVKPRVIMLENVPEIQSWGPLDIDGKPIKEKAGSTFKSFVRQLEKLDYVVEYREMKSCDYGAPTTRKRFYLIARCDGKPIVWPEPTHGPKNSEAVKLGKLLPYRTAAECIDWTIPTTSIFDREKPLAENTMKRIARGIEKFVLNNLEPYIVPVSQSNDCFTANRYGFASAFIAKNYGGGYTGAGSDAEDPLHTITAQDHNSLITAHITTLRNHMDGQAVDEPLSTITSSGAHHASVTAFLAKYYGDGDGAFAQAVDEPLHTITTKDRFGLVTIHGEDYMITDIHMRMLQPHELFKAQGFPDDYIIDRDYKGNPYAKSKQVARCGNAVTPPVPTAMVRANLPEYCIAKEIAV